MATKREELTNPNECLAKVADEEPIFILRATDKLAPHLVRLWAAMVVREHMEGWASGALPTEKLTRALKCALSMEAWQAQHGGKVPD